MQPPECLLLLLLLFPSAVSKVSADTDGSLGVIDNSKQLESEVRRLKRVATNNRRNVGKKSRVCESVSDQVARDITQELSGLRAQLHTSDVMTSLRAELQAGLASVRAEASDKAVVMRKELEAALAGLRTELQKLRAELQAELNSDLNDVRSELQHAMTTSCSDQKEVAAALADLQSGLSAARSDVEQRVSSARAELEQRVSGVRSELEGGLAGVKADFKASGVVLRSNLQDMVADLRAELQESVSSTRSELQSGFVAAQSGLQNSVSSIQADMMSSSAQMQKELASLRAEIPGSVLALQSDLQADLAAVGVQCRDNISSLHGLLQTEISQLATKVQEVSGTQTQLSDYGLDLEAKLSDTEVTLTEGVAALRADVTSELSSVRDEVKKILEANKQKVDGETRQVRELVQSSVAALRVHIENLAADVIANVTELVSALEAKVDGAASKWRPADNLLLTSIAERNKLLGKLAQNVTAPRDQLLAGKADVGGWSSAFVRWGRSECPSDSEIVYRGFVGGSSYDSDGAAANRLCLTATPRPANVTGARTYIYGAEYKFAEHHDMDVVCAVCRARLAVTVMVPGTDVCPEGWTLQYAGHLTAGMVGHRAASEYLCLDASPEHRPGSHESRNGALFYYVFAQCGSLPCPPYANMYLTCAVCSR